MARTRAIGEPERLDRVANQNDDEHQPEVQKIPVHVLEDEREESLPQVAMARFSNRAGQRIGPERFVIGAAIVIAGEAESARRPQNQQRCRKRERARPPPRFRPEPRVMAVAKQQRRIKRRQVRAIFEMVALKGSPCRVDDERGECEKNEERLKPPRVATSCFSKLSLGQGPHGLRHRESSEYGPVSRQTILALELDCKRRWIAACNEPPYVGGTRNHKRAQQRGEARQPHPPGVRRQPGKIRSIRRGRAAGDSTRDRGCPARKRGYRR